MMDRTVDTSRAETGTGGNACAPQGQQGFPPGSVQVVPYSVLYQESTSAPPVCADYVILQTLQDSPGWAREGALLNYAPAGFDHVDQTFKGSTACWYAALLV